MNHILTKTFESGFGEDNYKDLVVNLFNRFDFSKEQSLKQHFTNDEKQKINDFTYLGSYEDTEKKSLDVLIVELKGGSKVERARSLQRNLIGKYLKGNLKDSALVAFYSKDNPDWRLSFVRMDYKLDAKGAKVEIGTPPKRYSFLVGKNEPSYTAKKQFEPFLHAGKVPTIDEIEKAFSVEKVTKEFYVEIAKKFTELVGGERKIGARMQHEDGLLKLPSTADDTIKKEFAVRLIGRLLFCWFLKKKKSEAGKPLLTSVLISSEAVKQEPNYYHRFLEPLFFQVLNTKHDKRMKCFSADFWSMIPFLNGGLFEPHLKDFYEATEPFGHSKHINTLKIDDEWFKGLFGIFEEYNFTIDESTTVDVDISVDPEMLGRIFENLLAEINPETGETARKSTGSYYTPRPIVEYMVDESLKQYLRTQLADSKAVVPAPSSVIPAKAGIHVSQDKMDSPVKPENDDMENKLSKLLSYGDEPIDLSESEKDSIIDALDRVKIIDPACGSGAFPMGILHKMLLILQKIDPESKKWVDKKLLRIDNKLLRQEMGAELKRKNWDYIHKLGIIQNSIYGVDIQTIAVEISKLRFFLSLIVDEKIDDGKLNRGVVPLPNLEFKFVAADSLIGLPQIDDKVDWSRKSQGADLWESRDDINKLKELRDEYFTASGNDKRSIENDFKETQRRMFLHSLNGSSTGSQTFKLSEWNPFEDDASSWFDADWMFGVSDGFDVVIANPPYIRHEDIKSKKPLLKERFGDFFCGTADIYTYFYKAGIEALKPLGHLCFIAPNKFMRAGYGRNTRKLLTTDATPKTVIDFCDLPIFDATTYPSVLLLQKRKPSTKEKTTAVTFSNEAQLENITETIESAGFKMPVASLRPEGWNLEMPEVLALMEKLRKAGKPLGEYVNGRFYYGIKTGLNEAFVIDAETRKRLISEDPKSKELINPWLRGRDIKKWKAEWAGLYVISIASSANRKWPWSDENTELKARTAFKKTYPAIHDHLSQWEERLINRDDQGKFWWELRSCAYYKEFEGPKIIWGNMAISPKFAFDNDGYFISAPANLLPVSDSYLVGLLNSSICNWLIAFLAAVRGGNFLEFKPMYVEQLPVYPATEREKAPIIERVEKILANPDSADVPRLEAEIDHLVYALYGLTPAEIEIVEGKR